MFHSNKKERVREREGESIIIITNNYACILLIPNDCFLKLPDVFQTYTHLHQTTVIHVQCNINTNNLLSWSWQWGLHWMTTK